MSRLTRDGTAELVSRDQILRREQGQENTHFPCSADHEQDWQPYPVDPCFVICNGHTFLRMSRLCVGGGCCYTVLCCSLVLFLQTTSSRIGHIVKSSFLGWVTNTLKVRNNNLAFWVG